MNWQIETPDELTPSAGEGRPTAAEVDIAIFHGDTGHLPLDVRRAMVQLLLGPSLDSHRQSKLWPVLVRHEQVVRSRLHELFLELVIDHEQGVAFTRQVVSDVTELPILLRKSKLTFIETALLLYLRARLTQADAQGERAVVSLNEMLEHLAVFERVSNQDRSRFRRQTEIAVEKVKKSSLLRLVHGTGNRFEVAPTLKLLFSADEINQLMRHYDEMERAVAQGTELPAADAQGEDDDSGEDDGP